MLKSVFTTLRELLWTLIAVLAALALFGAVLAPAEFAGRLAGIFDELEGAGFDIKIKTPVGEASFDRAKAQQLVNSDREILDLRAELEAARGRIALLEATAPSTPTVVLPPAPLPETVPESRPELVIDPLIDPVPGQAGEPWVVIAGTERDLDSQRNELDALRRAGFGDAVILNSGGWYQTAVIYPDRAAADAALPRIAEVVGAGRGAYVRALDVICRDPAEVAGVPDLLACG
ncbi:hypothetical protein DKT77_07445 [Meridianimarinicoccus roseus]|uniref:SPOR domain-containing protein n=1 Tax=Meridianimarinicoccus roseus TaxID=2072018 RepID=A0A2V2LE01_9RHOB|nr:hypothetical protein [Meridianimarinicoccus roseus]PWR03292.1 hypothetical protein DKT77_07445 [Meridianimarinicoccus roseus]